MTKSSVTRVTSFVAAFGIVAGASGAQAQVTVINMIPNAMSNETVRDSEPNVAVNPANPNEIAASAFTPDPLASGFAPIYCSTDRGDHWVLTPGILPGGDKTDDTTIRYGTISNVLYASIMRDDTFHLGILRGPGCSAIGAMTSLVDRENSDQPWIEVATLLHGSTPDRAFVGNVDYYAVQNQSPVAPSTVDQSQSAAAAPPPAGFTTVSLVPRAACYSPGARPAIHLDGTIYLAYFRFTTCTASPYTSDIVVARDDNWASGATPYTALTDPPSPLGDGLAGVRVVRDVLIPYTGPPSWELLGTQRIGGQAAIAVDPRDHNKVYLAWGDGASAAADTMHVRLSLDGGATWGADLRTVVPATNPGLAINTLGAVGFLYQRLTGVAPNQRWETHFEYSTNDFATAPTDYVLANVPDQIGSYIGWNPIGDYANVAAVGKTFYGVFSGYNTPDGANFPNLVTYRRNANWATHQLRNVTDTANVAASIDPFFFRVEPVAPADDFYVRDWTDNVGIGDTGLEPSTHPVFFSTSDVWNRRGTLTGEPFTLDQPANEDAGNGDLDIGDNWAFARVRRNALPPSGSKTVTAHFLVSKLGTGSSYVDAGSADPDVTFPDPDPTLNFDATDLGPFTTTAYHWHLNAVSSTHLCLAVEISAPGDPFVAPSLVGGTPGWPTPDLRVILDNNKAQRNMGLSTTPALGLGHMDTMYAIAHNAATFPRDMVLRYRVPPDVYRRLGEARLVLPGQPEQPLRADGRLVLKGMQPGENRWIGVSLSAPGGKEGEVLPVWFEELVGEVPVNGFGLGVRLASDAGAARATLDFHRSVMTRLAAGYKLDGAGAEAAAAKRLLGEKDLTADLYARFVRDHFKASQSVVNEWLKLQGADPFGVAAAAKAFGADQAAALPHAAHLTLLSRLDAHITEVQLARGDVADSLLMARWQNDLYREIAAAGKPGCSTTLRDDSARFVTLVGRRKASLRDYPDFVKRDLPCLRETAQQPALAALGLARYADGIEKNLGNPAALQRAHREFLLQLQKAASDRRALPVTSR
jgi:hypothetical protein